MRSAPMSRLRPWSKRDPSSRTPRLHMDAVGPEVDVMLGGEIALAPARMLLRPGLLEPSDGGRRQPAGILAEQRGQRLLELAGGNPLEVEDRISTSRLFDRRA